MACPVLPRLVRTDGLPHEARAVRECLCCLAVRGGGGGERRGVCSAAAGSSPQEGSHVLRSCTLCSVAALG
jgi:hypothetical protein